MLHDHIGALCLLKSTFSTDRFAGGDKTGNRQRRDQDRQRKEQQEPAAIPALQPQPEMQAHTGMGPDHNHQRNRQPGHFRPITGDGAAVAVVEIDQPIAGSGIGQMQDQQHRNGEAEDQLYQFPARQA